MTDVNEDLNNPVVPSSEQQSLSSSQISELDKVLADIQNRNVTKPVPPENNSGYEENSGMSANSSIEEGTALGGKGITTENTDGILLSNNGIDDAPAMSELPPWMDNNVPLDLYAQYDTGSELDPEEYIPPDYVLEEPLVDPSVVSSPDISDGPPPHFDVTNENEHSDEMGSHDIELPAEVEGADEDNNTDPLHQNENIDSAQSEDPEIDILSSEHNEFSTDEIVLDEPTNDIDSMEFSDETHNDLTVALEEMGNKIEQQEILKANAHDTPISDDSESPSAFGFTQNSPELAVGGAPAINNQTLHQQPQQMSAPMSPSGIPIPSFGSLGARFNNYLNKKLAPGKEPDFNTFFTKKLDQELKLHQDNCRGNETILEKIVELSNNPDFNADTEKQVAELVDEYTQSKNELDHTTAQFTRMASGMPEYKEKLDTVNKEFAGNINSLSNKLEKNSENINSEAIKQMLESLFKEIRQFFNKITGRTPSASSEKTAAMG